MPSSSNQGYSAVFAAQKNNRGAYGKKNIGEASNYKELSVQNYAMLTAERLKREKELRAETAKRRKRQRQRAQNAKRAEEVARDKKLEERKTKKKSYVNYLRGHFTKVTVNKFESPRTKVQRTIDSITKTQFNKMNTHYENKKPSITDRQHSLKVENRRASTRNDLEVQHLLKKQTLIYQKEVRRNSKTLLQHLREQMKTKEKEVDDSGRVISDINDLNSSRIGALDLNIGLNRTKRHKNTKKSKKEGKKQKQQQQQIVNDSLSEEIIEEDENLNNILNQEVENRSNNLLDDSIAEEVEEELVDGNVDKEYDEKPDDEKKYTKIALSPSSKEYEVISKETNNNSENREKTNRIIKDETPWKLTIDHK